MLQLLDEQNLKLQSYLPIEGIQVLGRRIQERRSAYATRGQLDLESWRELADLGFWRIPIPRAYGGLGGDWVSFGRATRELATYSSDLSFLLSVIAHAGLIRLLLKWGTEDQKRHYFPLLCSGAVGATAITEPDAGSDIQNISTRAFRAIRGFRVEGEKVHITNGPVTDIFLLVCKTEGETGRDTSLFILEATDPGVKRGLAENMMGNHTSPTGPIRISGAEIPANRLVGALGEGLGILFRTISLDRALYAIATAGVLEKVLENSMDYSERRTAFGHPIFRNQYVQRRLTDIKIAIDTSDALGMAALSKIDSNDPEDVLAGSLAKLVATEHLVQAAEHYMIIHGHSGYESGPVTAFMMDALGTRIAGGTSDIQRVSIFNQMIRQRRRK